MVELRMAFIRAALSALTRSEKPRTVLILLACLTALTLSGPIPEVFAWNISVNPQNQPTAPGGTVTYAVSLDYDPGEVLGFVPLIQLIVDPIAGLTVSFNPETHVIPFMSTMTVKVDSSFTPGPYTIHVWAHLNPGSSFPGPDDKEFDVGLAVLSGPATLLPITDWALSNLRIMPPSPKVGDHVTFAVDLTALSTNSPYPQTVYVNWWVDGTDGNGQSVTYHGPTGATQTITFSSGEPNMPKQWTATAGTHTLGATVDLKPKYNDPDRSNNEVSLTITVGTGPSTPFDFNMALSPFSASVNPGGTANYMILLSYSDPSYSGTMINIQLTGLGPGMDWHLSQNGGLTITTSRATPAGSYALTIVGSASGVRHTTGGTLIVTAGQPTTVSPTTVIQTSMLPTTVTQTAVSPTAVTVAQTTTAPTSGVTTTSPREGSFIDMIPGGAVTLAAVAGVIILAAAAIFLFRRRGAGPPTAAPTPPSTAPAAAPPTPTQPLSVKYCISCGAQIPRSAKFCPECRANQTE